MQPLSTVKETIVRTNILDKYIDVQVDPSPVCVQGNEQFFLVNAKLPNTFDTLHFSFFLRSKVHSAGAEEFNLELECILESATLNNLLSTSKNIAKVYGVKICKDPITGLTYSETLLEDCGENIFDYVMNGKATIIELADYMNQVLQGLTFAHSKKLYHGNLRTDKVFIKDKKVKIIDFAGTIFLGSENDENAKRLIDNWNSIYYPPDRLEILTPNLSREEKMSILYSFDIYGFGMICYQLLSKKSLKVLDTEEGLYKKNMMQYKEFNKILKELFETNKGNRIFVYYFEPLLKSTLEFDRFKRSTITNLHEKSKKNLRRITRKQSKKRDSDESDIEMYEEEEEEEEEEKALCYICMTENSSNLKALMECNHEACNKCLKHHIKKIVIDRSEIVLEPFCYSCRTKEKLKELYLECKCPYSIDKEKKSNKSKVLNYEKGRLFIACCNNEHELTEDEAFMIFGSLKLSLRNKNLTREDIGNMVEMLKRIQLIEILELAQNQIDVVGLDILVNVVASKEALRVLSLDWNPFGPNGGKPLKILLETSTSLRTLSVGKVNNKS